MADLTTAELLTSTNRTADNEFLDFTIDVYRCGKCSMEFSLMDDFICHKVLVEKNSLIFWESEKISGLQIPRFLENCPPLTTLFTPENITEETTGLHEDKEKLLPTKKTEESLQDKAFLFPKKANNQLPEPVPCMKSQANINLVPSGSNENPTEKSVPECSICGFTYKDFTVLRTHVATVHSTDRPFQCKFSGCDNSFKTKACLLRHERRHTGERPFACEKCGRSFRESGTLARHLKSRVPCVNKAATDLPRYGHSLALTSNLSNNEISKVRQNAETLQIVITQVPVDQPMHMKNQMNTVNIHCGKTSQVEEVSTESRTEGLSTELSELLDVTKKHKAAESNVPLSDSPSLQEPLIDPPCVLEPSSLQKALTQQLLDHNLQCIVCDNNFEQSAQLIQHLQQEHLREYLYRCCKCFFVSKDKDSLMSHGRIIHDQRNVHQTKENRNWTEEAVMQLLILNDIIDGQEPRNSASAKFKRNCGPHRCHICLKKFRSRGYFNMHMGTHTGEQSHACQLCDKSFICRDSLQKHLITHSQARSFKCEICNKMFKRANHIKEHLRTHSDDRYFFCNICGRGFKWKGALKSHELTHGRNALFECDECDHRFRSKSSMKRHARRHLNLAHQTTEQQLISTSFDDVVNSIQLPNVSTEPSEGQEVFLLILEDGSTCLSLVPDGEVIQAGVLDPTNIWRQTGPTQE